MNSFAFAQNVEVKDSDNNILMRVEDEGATGSIYLNSGAVPAITTNKLYNEGGALRWSGAALGSPLWSQNGSAIYYNSGKVGIGVSSLTADLQVSGIDGALFTGIYASGTIPAEGAGSRLMWYPKKAAFRVGHVDGTHWDDANIGHYSVALGYNSQATNTYSTAIGLGTLASGSSSIALGENTTASGIISTALGYSTTASGQYSLAAGFGIQASGNYSMAIALSNQSGTNVTQANTLAIMGGKVGIGTIAPTANLQVHGVNGALFTGGYNNGIIPAEGAGTRMMWYPKKAAFRFGWVTGTNWDDANIGTFSFAGGYNTMASGSQSFAFGEGSIASNHRSFSFGLDCNAAGEYSFAFGRLANTGGLYTFACGNDIEALGNYSVAFGAQTSVTGGGSFAYALDAAISGNYSILLGLNNLGGIDLEQSNTMAIMGGNVAVGSLTPARKFEVHDNINSYVTLIKNTENDIGDGLRITLHPTNPDADNHYIDFMRNAVGTLSYAGWICGNGTGGVVYNTTSDERLKMNVRDYTGALGAVSQIRVRQYEMKSAPGNEEIGFLAQELMKVFPQAVSGDPNGDVTEEPMGVDYGRITPLLVAAIQEQQELIEELRAEIEELKADR